jgi:hypothetical protein
MMAAFIRSSTLEMGMKGALEVWVEAGGMQRLSMCNLSYLHRMRKGLPRCSGMLMALQRKVWCP